ncbi:MAG: zinc ABC transporter substrate-binding protein [Lachnospiraceae bacterium]|nr:zinc ABC transporter substrate-binding protein [Lachnospiraceae bacterium]
MNEIPMKRRWLWRLASWLLILVLAGCSGARPEGGAQRNDLTDHRLNVVATIFPYYDFVRQIGGEWVDLTLIVPAGMDSHSFEPTPADMRRIQEADVLICNGGAMEHWLDQVLEAVDASEITVVVLMDYVDIVEEELVEGMENEAHGDHAGEEGFSDQQKHTGHEQEKESFQISGIDDDGYHVDIEYDEHIWTSPVNAMKMTEIICAVLGQEDPPHAKEYQAAASAYRIELERIDRELRQVMGERRRNLIVLGDKFPFRYLAEEYDLDYRAAFSGCSTDTEPSARTIAYLIDKVKQERIPVIYYLELSSTRVAEIISEETGAQPLLLHSCHNVTRRQMEAGVTYVELMEQNVENLRKGLDE